MTKKKEEESAEEMYARYEAEEKAETEQKALERMGNPNLPAKRQEPEVSASELKRDIEESQRNEEFESWEKKRGLSKEKLNEHPSESFTFGERAKSGVKEFASDLNLKHTAPGKSVIRNTLDLLASGQFSTKETHQFSQGVSDVRQKIASERGGSGKPISGLYPVGRGSSRDYTKKQTMKESSGRSSKSYQPMQSSSPVFRNIGNLASTQMDFVNPIFGTAPQVAKTNKRMPSAKKGNPYDLGFRL
jgi:hypothetical protein